MRRPVKFPAQNTPAVDARALLHRSAPRRDAQTVLSSVTFGATRAELRLVRATGNVVSITALYYLVAVHGDSKVEV